MTIDTNLPKGTVVRFKDTGQTHTLTGKTRSVQGLTGLALEGGGWLYPEEISEIVSVPESEPETKHNLAPGTVIATQIFAWEVLPDNNPKPYGVLARTVRMLHESEDLHPKRRITLYVDLKDIDHIISTPEDEDALDYNRDVVELAIRHQRQVEFIYPSKEGRAIGRGCKPLLLEDDRFTGIDTEKDEFRTFKFSKVEGEVEIY